MDKSWMNIYDRINDTRYEAGVIEFLDFAYRGRDESLAIPCPCRKESDDDDGGGGDDVPFDGSDGGGDDMSDDDLDEMLDNIGQSTLGENWQTNTLRKLLDESHEELYEGCQTFSKLQRLFIDKQVASDMRWHKEKRVRDDNIARHPADTEAKVEAKTRGKGNEILGCLDTPVNIDVYLEPLIDELKDLWAGVNAYDALRKEDFTLRAALLWTINDFSAYGMLSGWSVKGYNACPTCMDETSSHYLKWGRKVCYTGHQRFLPLSHKWRKDKTNFDGLVDNRAPIAPKSRDEVLYDIECSIGVLHSMVNKNK
ncbi:leucine-rich repeat protein, partial [Tanacetum coccineum]